MWALGIVGMSRRGEKMMGGQSPGNRRTDDQLEAILFETAAWTVNGRNGQPLCTAPGRTVLRGGCARRASLA